MSSGIVYAYTNKLNGKMYIGQTRNPERRHRKHMLALTRCWHFNNAVRKYGPGAFAYEVLAEGIESIEDLDEAEKYFIWLFRSQEHGYNMTAGGEGVDPVSARIFSKATHADPEKKLRHWESVTKRCGISVVCVEQNTIFPSMSDAARAVGGNPSSISKVCLGILATSSGLHWRYATKAESEALQVIEKTNRSPLSKFSRSEIMRISLSSPDTRRRMREGCASRKRAVFCVEQDKAYESLSEACLENGLPVSYVANLLKAIGNQKRTFAGMHWTAKKKGNKEEVEV